MDREEILRILRESFFNNFTIKIFYGDEFEEYLGIVENIDDEEFFNFYVPGDALYKKMELSKVLYLEESGCNLQGLDELKIYVDDNREVPMGYVLAKSVAEAKTLIEKALKENIKISEIDVDHDLGDYRLFGGDAVNLIDYMILHEITVPCIRIHSANAVGVNNIQGKLDVIKMIAGAKNETFTSEIYKVWN